MTTGMNSAPLDRLMVFTGNANPRLAQDVAKHLNLPIGRAIVGKFSDGEVLVELIENVRGKDAFVLQSTCAPTNDNLMELLVMVDVLKQRYEDLIVVSPDVGGVVRARALAKRLESDLAIIDKRRPKANVAEVMNVIGEVSGRTCVIMDDMVDTAGTLVKAAQVLKNEGATKVVAYCTHPVLSGGAVERIASSPLDELVVTDTIPLRDEARQCKKIRQLSVAGLLAETILRIYTEESVSSLFIE